MGKEARLPSNLGTYLCRGWKGGRAGRPAVKANIVIECCLVGRLAERAYFRWQERPDFPAF